MASAAAASDHRHVVTVGASAGGVVALPRLLSQLPAGLPAAVLIVQHLTPTSIMQLVDILQRATPLQVAWAEHGDPLTPGRVLVAPPGVHLLIDHDRVALAGGPRENRSRPSINRLFRSAAAHHPGRSVGVLLTGMLDDGVAGLVAIKKAGGVTVVQDPVEAEYPSMPRSAIAAGAVDHIAPLEKIGPLLVTLVRERAAIAAAVPIEVQIEAKLDAGHTAEPESFARFEHTALSCSECGGPMWEAGDPGARTFRCFLGHAESGASLLSSQGMEVERALWAAVRALQDRALIFEKMARDALRLGTARSAEQYASRGAEARAQADRAREFLIELQRRINDSDAVAEP
jgi:two-component system chemotaxis response regulator CheB